MHVCMYIRTIIYKKHLHLTSFMMLKVGDGEANLNGNEWKSKAFPQWYGNSNTSCIYPIQQILPQLNVHCMHIHKSHHVRICTYTHIRM